MNRYMCCAFCVDAELMVMFSVISTACFVAPLTFLCMLPFYPDKQDVETQTDIEIKISPTTSRSSEYEIFDESGIFDRTSEISQDEIKSISDNTSEPEINNCVSETDEDEIELRSILPCE